MPTYAVTDKETGSVRYVEATRIEAAVNHVVAERFSAERIKIESTIPPDPVMPELRAQQAQGQTVTNPGDEGLRHGSLSNIFERMQDEARETNPADKVEEDAA